MSVCVVNFAANTFDRGQWYEAGQRRLLESLGEHGYTGDILFFNRESEIHGCPPHSQVPYAFKPYALEAARKAGHANVLWCDSSVWAIRPVRPLFDYLHSQSHVFFTNASTGEWTSDVCLKYFGLTREEAMNVPMLMGLCMGFNLACTDTELFSAEWLHLACTHPEIFQGSWTNDKQQVSADPRCKGHRHDQSVASILAWRSGMTLIDGPSTFCQYYRNPTDNLYWQNPTLELIGPTVCFVSQGIT